MNKGERIDDILSKIEEMRGFFRIGDEIIPFLGDLFVFLRDVMPLMSEVNLSLQESTHKLPTASDKILSVTETTEVATHQILDKLDSISGKLGSLATELQTNGDTSKYQDDIEAMQNEVSDIIFSLQFQDITAQQLEHANRILKAIHEKFIGLFQSIEAVEIATRAGRKVMRLVKRDGESQELKKRKESFEEKTGDVMRSEGISQEDIDQMFAR